MTNNPYLPEGIPPEELPPALPSPPAGRSGCLVTTGTVTAIFVVLTVLALVYFGALLVNPYLPINPFPPRTPLPIYVVASPDPAGAALLASPTKQADAPRLTTLVPTATPSVTPSVTPSLTATPMAVVLPRASTSTPLVPTMTLVAGVRPGVGGVSAFTLPAPVDPALVTRSALPFTLAQETVLYVANPGADGCRWASIAGTAVNLTGDAIVGLAVRVVGEGVDEIRFTGTAPAFGPGGYEVFLNSNPLEGQYSVQLLSQTGTPVSDALSVTTSASCDSNVAIVNFVQNHDY